MEIVFLEDGRQAKLIAKTDKGYVVDPYATYQDYETEEEYAEPSGKVLQVAKVFKVAPVDVVNAEYKEVLDKIEQQENILREKRNELSQLEYKIKNTKTDLNRFIINREELRLAKRLIIWATDEIAPRIMDGSKSHKFNVSYEISQYKNEERVWCFEASFEDRERSWSNYSRYFDAIYGIKTNLSDEEILTLTIDRIPRFKKEYHSWEYAMMRTDDEWLSPEFIAEKQQLIENNKVRELQKAEENLKKAQAEYDRVAGVVKV